MSSPFFQFKQFSVSQDGCAMRINTDGVILGALAGEGLQPETVLDIGTGTGVIALMLAQRFPLAIVDALEIDRIAAQTAEFNFSESVFSKRLRVYPESFQDFAIHHPDKQYDLIVTNPPFFVNSLKNPNKQKETARHADHSFFEELASFVRQKLTQDGVLAVVLPLETASLFARYASLSYLHLIGETYIHSYSESEPHRIIQLFSLKKVKQKTSSFVIYSSIKQYSEDFVNSLKDFFIIF
ncbi:tRNA1(Val) (adenine(37)-N6)-methyltransferase [Pedobacter sp. SYSU D00535]|uniref:tRNA1(Val) (adenine(37)-N6)-methyltransferase n=1 Tax=Pedobacter sp. SYSU D00535 TaxID=2810308 RepID=UPI001A96A0DA|nr:methyltransferase [Pedobacter sp. SYSU D00535]